MSFVKLVAALVVAGIILAMLISFTVTFTTGDTQAGGIGEQCVNYYDPDIGEYRCK